MEIKILPIARIKLTRRDIAIEWVTETVENPTQIVSGYGGRKIAQRKYNIGEKEYLLRVVFQEEITEIIVISAYLTSQIKKYWREES